MTPLKKIRMGMVGGGPGAFIGQVHRCAAAMDAQIELVAGAFCSDPARSESFGRSLGLEPERCYPDFRTMMKKEAELPSERRMHFVAIVTPNHMHYSIAEAALPAGFHVLSDKPATVSLAEANALRDLIRESGLKYCLTHNYTGYPMVRQARELVRSGELGTLRKLVVEYPQGWLASAIEQTGQKQAAWRTDPARAGSSNCMGDIGTHAENLAEFISGLEIKELAADLSCFGEGRTLDDDGNVLLRFEGGAKGILHASQISTGEENDLNIRLYGEKGGLQWKQQEPNTLLVHRLGQPSQIYRTGQDYLSSPAIRHCRLPAGHTEGYLGAFANLYRNFATDLRAALTGETSDAVDDYPGIEDGIRGLAFIEACVKSSRNNAAWTLLSSHPS